MAGDRAVIFDLDQTLVDSSALEPLRKARNWRAVYAGIAKLNCYDGVGELLAQLRSAGLRIGIVTSSPHAYCSKVVQVCAVQIDACVCYHDTKRHKPDPEPLQLALERLGDIEPKDAVTVGDVVADIVAGRAAGIYSIGALWGCNDLAALKAAKPDCLVNDVRDLHAAIFNRFKIRG